MVDFLGSIVAWGNVVMAEMGSRYPRCVTELVVCLRIIWRALLSHLRGRVREAKVRGEPWLCVPFKYYA